jgi:hypothetical protein
VPDTDLEEPSEEEIIALFLNALEKLEHEVLGLREETAGLKQDLAALRREVRSLHASALSLTLSDRDEAPHPSQ